FSGSNVAGLPVYHQPTGRSFDGVDPQGVSINSGAESNVETQLAMSALDGTPGQALVGLSQTRLCTGDRLLSEDQFAAAAGAPALWLWLDGAHDAPANMARDAALLERAAEGAEDVVLRLFTFAPAGITVGRAQDPARELDLARLAAEAIPWAVRPTGGRAIWHDEEWTFSLVTPLGASGWAPTPAEAYARTGALLAAAFQHLGVPAELAPGTPRGPGAPRARSGAAPPCFASTARHELVLGGRKLAGIAQRAVRGALLQQGSLLLGHSHVRLADYMRVPEAQRAALRQEWRQGAAEAGSALGPDRSLVRLAQALAHEWPGARRLEGEHGAAELGLPPRR
ncbi:MAG: hypothetical protein ABL977_10915, partial [Candidatus Eisenbacteria bacterium]